MPSRRLLDNPFHVLGLGPEATPNEVDAAGRGALAALAARAPGANRYLSPLGPQLRDAASVRRALARLRDPDERIHHEIWARLGPNSAPAACSAGDRAVGWSCAPKAMGWWVR